MFRQRCWFVAWTALCLPVISAAGCGERQSPPAAPGEARQTGADRAPAPAPVTPDRPALEIMDRTGTTWLLRNVRVDYTDYPSMGGFYTPRHVGDGIFAQDGTAELLIRWREIEEVEIRPVGFRYRVWAPEDLHRVAGPPPQPLEFIGSEPEFQAKREALEAEGKDVAMIGSPIMSGRFRLKSGQLRDIDLKDFSRHGLRGELELGSVTLRLEDVRSIRPAPFASEAAAEPGSPSPHTEPDPPPLKITDRDGREQVLRDVSIDYTSYPPFAGFYTPRHIGAGMLAKAGAAELLVRWRNIEHAEIRPVAFRYRTWDRRPQATAGSASDDLGDEQLFIGSEQEFQAMKDTLEADAQEVMVIGPPTIFARVKFKSGQTRDLELASFSRMEGEAELGAVSLRLRDLRSITPVR